MWKKLNLILCFCLISIGFNFNLYAQDDFIEEDFIEEITENPEYEYADAVSTQALDDYVVEGSLFERITTLEQEKVVMQLEKERAQLDLELERLNAEKIKLQMELDTLSGRAQQQQQELEAAKTQLEIQTEKLRRQKESIENNEEGLQQQFAPVKQQVKETSVDKKYKLVNVVGMDNQLQATIQDVSTGQNRRISVGKELDGYIVKSISLNDGITLEKNGDTESLNIGK